MLATFPLPGQGEKLGVHTTHGLRPSRATVTTTDVPNKDLPILASTYCTVLPPLNTPATASDPIRSAVPSTTKIAIRQPRSTECLPVRPVGCSFNRPPAIIDTKRSSYDHSRLQHLVGECADLFFNSAWSHDIDRWRLHWETVRVSPFLDPTRITRRSWTWTGADGGIPDR